MIRGVLVMIRNGGIKIFRTAPTSAIFIILVPKTASPTPLKNFLTSTLQSQKVFFRYYRRKGFKRFFKENILETDGTPKTKALSVALGIFVGLTPLWGFHTVIVLFLATVFRLNKLISYMCTHISFPVFVPFIIMISLWIGGFFIPGTLDFSHLTFNTDLVKNNIMQFLVGNAILTTSAAVIFGLMTYISLERFGKK